MRPIRIRSTTSNTSKLDLGTQASIIPALAFIGESDEPGLLLNLDEADAAYEMAVNLIQLRNTLLGKLFDDPKTVIHDLNQQTGAVRASGNVVLMRNVKQASKQHTPR